MLQPHGYSCVLGILYNIYLKYMKFQRASVKEIFKNTSAVYLWQSN